MQVTFRFKPGDQVTDRHEPGLFTGIVDKVALSRAGEKLVALVSPVIGFPLLTVEGQPWHKESDLTPAGDAPAEDEPTFTLRGRDTLASESVRHWAWLALEAGVNEAKVAGAEQIADAMDAYPHHRLPD